MISFKCALFALCAIFVDSKNIDNRYGLAIESKICQNIAIAVNGLDKLNDADFWNFYDCAGDNNDICVACEDMVFNLRNTFANSFKVAEFLSICHAYGIDTLSSQCDLIEDQCIGEFILLLNSKMTSSAICTSVQSSNATINALLNTNDENIKCKICEEFLQDLKNFLTRKSTKLGVLNALKTICDLTFGELKKGCVYYAHKYYEDFYKFVEKLDPRRICFDFSLYVTQIEKVVYSGSFKNWAITSVDKELCSMCKVLVKLIQKALNNQRTTEEVKSTVKQICKLIPSKPKAEKCELQIIKYTDLILGILAVEVDPSLVCPMIKLCTIDIEAEDILPTNYADLNTNEIMPDDNNLVDNRSIFDWNVIHKEKYNDDKEIADILEKQIDYTLQAICLYFYADEDKRKCYEALSN